MGSNPTESKLEKAISICNRKTAAAEEILAECMSVCKVRVRLPERKNLVDGLLSCSVSKKGSVALCLWIEEKDSLFRRVSQTAIRIDQVMTLRGVIEMAFHEHLATLKE